MTMWYWMSPCISFLWLLLFFGSFFYCHPYFFLLFLIVFLYCYKKGQSRLEAAQGACHVSTVQVKEAKLKCCQVLIFTTGLLPCWKQQAVYDIPVNEDIPQLRNSNYVLGGLGLIVYWEGAGFKGHYKYSGLNCQFYNVVLGGGKGNFF